MLKLTTAILMVCAMAFAAQAADATKPKGEKKKAQLTEEQKKDAKAITEKYDKNKDGKLDKEERQAMSKEDKDKLNKIYGRGEAKKKQTQ